MHNRIRYESIMELISATQEVEQKKPIYLMYVNILSDGIGDYYHFEDLMRTLLTDPHYADVEFVAIIYFDYKGKNTNYTIIDAKLKALFGDNIPYYYGKTIDHIGFKHDQQLVLKLKSADQVVLISHESNIFRSRYDQYISKDVPK